MICNRPSHPRFVSAAFVLTLSLATTMLAQSEHRGPTAASAAPAVTAQAAQPTMQATPAQNPAQRIAPPPFRPNTMPQRTPPSAELADRTMNDKVDQLLKDMSVDEKVGQLVQYSGGESTGPGGGLASYDDLIAQGKIGSFLNVTGPRMVNHYQHIAMEKSPHKIPLIFGLDVIHGYTTEFPVPLAMASSFDPDAVELASRVAATEAAADGVRWTFSPMVDIARDARWGRIVEGAGEDPYLGSAMARAYIEGYQGKSLSDPTSIAACVKHFAAYGAAEAGREYNTTDMSDYTLRGVYLPPYKAAIDAGAATVMSSFNSLNGIPASANPYTLTRILRREWGFQGFVVSDWASVREIEAHGVANDDATAAYKSLTAGVDMDMQGNIYGPQVGALIKENKIPPSVLDEAVRRILRVKFALGLFDHPYSAENNTAVAITAAKREQERKVAEESVVLLKNANNILPLRLGAKSDLKTIALIGPMGDSQQDMLGSWGAQSKAADAITLRTALTERLQGKAKLLYEPGCDLTTTSEAGFKDAVKAAKSADIVLLALGEKGDETGEATSRTFLDNPGTETEQKLLEAITATGKPIVLVLFNGHPLALTKDEPLVSAIVEAWYPGTEAGHALANLLDGTVNFSGKLPVSLPRSVGQEPLYYAQLPTGRPAGPADLSKPPYNSETKYLSRYIDEQNTPLYPFGFGLSYTTFAYSAPLVSTPSLTVSKLQTPRGQSTEEKIAVGVDVQNTGSVAGTDVAQLYMRVTGASTEQPMRLLKGFERITLAPGEKRHIEFKLGFDELAHITMRGSLGVEPADYEFYVGDSSQAATKVAFTIDADPRVEHPESAPAASLARKPAGATAAPLMMKPIPAPAAPATK